MDTKQFKKLKVGDLVFHPHTGRQKIVNVETWRNETFAITVQSGNRMKVGDYWDVPKLQLIDDESEDRNGI